MIPSTKRLKKRLKKSGLKVEEKPYFSLVNEFLILQKKFETTFFEICLLGIDMILYPLYILYQLFQAEFSPLYILAISKTYGLWMDYIRFRELKKEIDSWISIVKKLDGPWISTNDSQYHLYVYADAMQRLVFQKTD
jgi:hypothetical protein